MKYTNKEYATLAHQATLKGKLLVVHSNGSYEMIDLSEPEVEKGFTDETLVMDN